MTNRGWRDHPREHALAARGIPCRASAVFRPYRPTGPIDYEDPEDFVKAFWKASLEDDYSGFDFDKAFDAIEKTLWYKLATNHLLSWEDEVEAFEWAFGKEGAHKIIARMNYRACWEDSHEARKMEYPYSYLYDLYLELTKNRPTTQLDKILLMDQLIHAEHQSGSILRVDELQVEDLRWEFDREYGRGG